MSELKFTGGAELEKALEALGEPRFMRAAGRRALRKAAKPILEQARADVPRETGLTAKDIKIRNEEGIAVSVGLSGAKGGRAFIGRFHEFGTAKMEAHPFLRPAVDDNAQAALNILSEQLGNEIEKQAAKVKK